jgi:hypothetical protein
LLKDHVQPLIGKFRKWGCDASFDYIDQIPSAFWNALFEFHRSICDQTIETSVLLTKVEELFEDHVQPLIGKLRKWGCDASPTFKYWMVFAVPISLQNTIEAAGCLSNGKLAFFKS